MELFNQGVGTASYTWQGVAKLSVMDKLTIVESCDTVQVEAVQANHVTVGTLEDQDRAPDICARYAGDAAAVTGDQVQSDRRVLVRGWVRSAFKEKFCSGSRAVWRLAYATHPVWN